LRKIPTPLRGTNFCTSSARFASSFVSQLNSPKCTKIVWTHQNMSLGSNGVDRVRSLRKILTQLRGTKFSTSSARFGPSFVSQPNSPKCTKFVRTHQNMSLGSNGVDRVRWLRKIPTQLRGMNFCTSSARFTPSFVTQPNGHNAPKLYEMHQNMSLKSNRIYRVRSFRKISMRLRATNFCTSSTRFAPSFVSQPNGPKCTKIVRNAPKHEFRVQWCGTGAFVAKNSDTASWHKLLHQFGPFCIEFCKSTKRSQMHQTCMNTPKHEFRVQWGGMGAFIEKNSDTASLHKLLHKFGPFCTEFRNSTKRSQMHPNFMKCTKTFV